MLSIKKWFQASSLLNNNNNIMKLHFSCFFVLGQFVRFLAVLRSIREINSHIEILKMTEQHSNYFCSYFSQNTFPSLPPLPSFSMTYTLFSDFTVYVIDSGSSQSQLVIVFNLSSQDDTHPCGPEYQLQVSSLLQTHSCFTKRKRVREGEWILTEHAGFSCIRGNFTLTRRLLTLAHRAGTVLQHITVSIWHCLLCLMPTHTNTHACAQTTPEHQANHRHHGTSLLATGKADAWSPSKTKQESKSVS